MKRGQYKKLVIMWKDPRDPPKGGSIKWEIDTALAKEKHYAVMDAVQEAFMDALDQLRTTA